MPTANKPVRLSVTLPANVAAKVRRLAKARKLSANRMLRELIENGMEAEKRKQQEFFDLAERFRNATDPAEVERLGDRMGRNRDQRSHSLETRCNPLILHSGFSGVDAMCDRPPGLSEADVRGSGAAYQVSSLYERRPQSARGALRKPSCFVGQVGKPAADWGRPYGPGLFCGAANPGRSRLSAASLRLRTRRFPPPETLPKGSSVAHVNASFRDLDTPAYFSNGVLS